MTIAATNKDIVAGRAGNTLFVDAQWGEDDPKGLREYSNRPFKTIMAAVNAATAGDTVFVMPGEYDEDTGVDCKDGVSIVGQSQDKCIITATGVIAGNVEVVLMAENMTLQDFTIISDPPPVLLPPGPPPTGIGLLFPAGTANANSTARNITIKTAVGKSANGVSDQTTAAGLGFDWSRAMLDNVTAAASGVTNGYIKSGTGSTAIRNCTFQGFVGCSIAAGTVGVRACSFIGYVGFSVGAAGTAYADRGTAWSNLTNSGTLNRQGAGFKADPMITAHATTTIGIPPGPDTLLLTLPPIYAYTNPTLINFSAQIARTGGGTRKVTFKLFRDGIEVNTADRYEQRLWTGPSADAWTSSMHWMDETPGNNPVYTILATANGTNVEARINRRATVTI